MVEISCTINGEAWSGEVEESRVLVDFLRREHQLTGTRVACDHAACGACTVLLDGLPVAACATLAFEADGGAISTIEGLADADGRLHPLQQAFLDESVFQCGFCSSGIIMLATALLDAKPDPSRQDIVEWMGANVCRCTGYTQIIDAIAHCTGKQKRLP